MSVAVPPQKRMSTGAGLEDGPPMTTPDDGLRARVEKTAGLSSPSPSKPQSSRVQSADDESIEFRKKTRTFDYLWRSGVAGGLAGCAAKTTVAPLDRVKILFQASNPHFAKYTGSWLGVATAMRDIRQHEGLLGLFRGHSATLLRIFPYAGIKFLAYEQVRSIAIPSRDKETPFRRFISGSLAGVTSVFFTYPLEVVRVRLAFETERGHSSLASICRRIYNEHTVSSTTASASQKGPIPPQAVANAASTAPAAATAAKAVNATAANAADAAAAAAPRSGLINFYRGFTPTILGMLPYAGVSFLTHDTAGDILRHPSIAKYTTLAPTKRDGAPRHTPAGKPAPLRSWAELLAGGLAGLVSQTASYPLEVVRRRMQVGGAVGDGRRMRLGETAKLILREKGARGFFVGLTIGYAKVVPMGAVSFYTYERAKLWFGI